MLHEPFDGPGAKGLARQALAHALVEKVLYEIGDVTGALAQRRQTDRHHVEAEEQVLAELPWAISWRRSRWVAAMMRTSVLMVRAPPTLWYSPSCSTRSNRVCALDGHVADLVEEQGGAAFRLLEAAGRNAAPRR